MLLSIILALLGPYAATAQVVFSEDIGTGTGNLAFAATTFQNSPTYIYTGTGDTRSTVASSVYAGASAGRNVYLGNTNAPRTFQMDGIVTTGFSNLILSFGAYKDLTASTMSNLKVEFSPDGSTWTALTVPSQPSGTGWRLITIPAATIPAVPNLRLRWSNIGTVDQFRIDDILLYTPVPTVNFSAASSSALEDVGVAQTITMAISPPTTVASTIIINIGATSTATYGAANDFTTSPAAVGTNITVNVPAGVTSASFNVNLVTDLFTEPNETIIFNIVGVTGNLITGSNVTHTFTIQNDDTTPTIQFGTLSATVLEGGFTVYTITFIPTPHPSGNVTITITNGTGATYPGDYTTTPDGSTGSFSLPFGPVTPSISFTVTTNNDGSAESTEMVTFTITAVPVGCVIGPNSSATLFISDINSPPTVLTPGDLAIVGVNANTLGCTGASGDDEVSFFCFEDIGYGTTLILTDNGYSRCTPGLWGTGEGTVRMTRTGATIPKGQVITFRFNGTPGPTNVQSVAPDAGWTCVSLGLSGTSINLNVGGEQLFFLQGGVWGPGTSTSSNDATYSGTVLFGFTTNPSFPWTHLCSSTQRSDLPPGVQCFSMSPTLASDFNKYIGPITPADQRDWIIRIDDQANWSSYSSCGQYNSSGYNWLTAAQLPIINGAMTHGLWRGGKNSDWFECKNWDDARVPDALTDVVINQTAIQNCSVGVSPGLSPGGTGVCSSLLLTSNGTGHLLVVEPNSTLNITNDLTVERTAGAGGQTVYVKDNATLTGRNLFLRSVNGTFDESGLYTGYLNSVSRFSGNVTIEPGGSLSLYSPIPANFGTLYIGGNYWNQRTELAFTETYSQVIFDGGGPQTITTNSFEELFYNLRVAKPTGELTLNSPIGVRSILDLQSGQVLSTSANLLSLKNGSSVTGVSNASFVSGPVQKIGNTPFTYPFGKNGLYRPATTTPAGAITTDAFTAEYFNTSPITPLGPTGLDHDATLHHVSACEYWTIDRSSGTPNATVTLSWQAPTSCGVTNLPDMRVGYWTGTLWTDAGGTSITGTNAAGTVSTAGARSTFLQATNYWTLASLTNANPLPIELLSFTAQPSGSKVDLKWTTASERNNDHFTVERSADALIFTALLQVPGAGNSQNVIDYTDTDLSPMHGLSYYRLRQTDFDGTTVVSDAVPVFFSSKGQPLQVLYSNDGLFVMHDFAPGSTLEVMDLTGRVVGSTGISAVGLVKVPLDGVAHGVYLLRMSDGVRVESTRMAY